MTRVTKLLITVLVVMIFSVSGFKASAQTNEAEEPPALRDEFFLVQGTVTEVRPEEKMLHVKIDAGLELTFYESESTRIDFGGQKKSLADLAAGDSVEIKYVYNEDYRKEAQAIFVKRRPAPEPAASEPEPSAEKA